MKRPDPAGRTVTALLVMLTALGPLSTDLYLPSLPAMRQSFATDVPTIQLTLSVYMIAFAVGQLIWGPLSDRYGRRGPLLVAGALYLGASILCMVAPTVEFLIAARLVQGVGGCAGQVVARAVVRDVHGRAGARRVLAAIAAAMGLAPAIAPAIGGVLTDAFGWSACFWVLSLVGAVALLGVGLLLRETNAACGTGTIGPGRIATGYLTLLRQRQFTGFALAATTSYSGLFAWISGSSHVFIGLLDVSPSLYGLCFSSVVVGFILGARLAGRLPMEPGRAVLLGAVINAVGGGVMLAVLLAGKAGVATILAPMILYMVGMGIVLPNAQAGAIGPFPRHAGAASSLIGFVQYGFAALVGLGVGHGFEGGASSMAVVMAGTIAACGAGAVLAYLAIIRGAPEPVEAAV
ncbi:multidrug effflux MFS transporter [Marivibrio halodurans]|uniref:Bcr/CflA family efflux transporter n=1 Tax=Marivibrio halodurans TaxID=2039722 RepID=A0A8J7S909_9PROT|nr:multidrug effflux MFS transporter [Marivibrio halodurans]MBP5859074.1 multidrug effflux MFS transporter [Marivibrio halodurans]